ncbi:hypothetical protein GCM10022267_31140 [Lentzea roselyniae]|uniref:Tat (Twin-arginine translocation) pathway signal sequence n=1 Tax=Lentzea roselyniae TaxID=531940 RepID=A0ABP7AXH8_9PSEU
MRWTRRQFLAASATAGAMWVPIGRLPAGARGRRVTARIPTLRPPVPAGVPELGDEIIADAVWTCEPRTADDVVLLAN